MAGFNMRIERDRNSKSEHVILIGMITDDTVCSKIATRWQPDGLFRSKYANLVGGWCVAYYKRYEKAPGKHLQHKCERWLEKTDDQHTADMVERFLVRLSDQFEDMDKLNTNYVLDVAGEHFALVRLQGLSEQLEDELDKQSPAAAHELLNQYSAFNLGVGEWFDPLKDKTAIVEAFKEVGKPLVQYEGALGEFFGNTLQRDSLVCFEGPEKRGKTFWLLDVVMRAVEQRRRVAYFQVGDMSRDQIMRRIMVRVARKPLLPCTVKIPLALQVQHPRKDAEDKQAKIRLRVRTRKHTERLTSTMAIQACTKFQLEKIRSYDSYLRLSVYPNDTLSVPQMQTLLQEWSRDGWMPDVVVIDYADILNMAYTGMDKRDQINKTWQDLRKLSQVLHCLVITATQTNAASYKANTVTKQHYSEDKRKRAHTLGNIGLNQTDYEKERGVMRLNWIQRREEYYVQTKCVYVAGCVELANLALRSTW